MKQAAQIVHVITDLNMGGAETTLHKLVTTMDWARFQHVVISLTKNGPIGELIATAGIPVYSLGMDVRLPNPLKILALSRLFNTEKPSLVQTWMYHADLIGGLGAKLAGNIPVIWNIRHAALGPSSLKFRTRLIVHSLALLSRYIPAKIISCSNQATKTHARLGYAVDQMITIPNGFNLNSFSPNSEARAQIRAELKVPPTSPLIGMVARFDPQKDHINFITAAGLLAKSRRGVHFLFCGKGCNWDNPALTDAINNLGLRPYFHLTGEQRNMPEIYSALDIFSLTSYSEAFPNVIGEAMACGIPCVVTDAGDSAEIVGENGWVVPVRDPQALAQAWDRLLSLPTEKRQQMGARARERIKQNYDLNTIVRRYESLYEEVLGK